MARSLLPALLLASALSPQASAGALVPVDTSGLMGSPEPVLPYDFEPAFPRLTFRRPVAVTHAGDGSGRLFVLEQGVVVRVFPNRPDVTPEECKTFLDLREVVARDHNEQGLLGIAFHPDFRANGRLYVFYSAKSKASVLSRFVVSRADPDRADRDSEQEVLRIPREYTVHNGGSMEFGPDGFLYVGTGDGGARDDAHGNGQNLGTLMGKILRIDMDRRDEGRAYAVPKDNPFVGKKGARGEIWAYGLRNPWRLSFDPATKTLWCGDVGEGEAEEINVITRGGNYGWNVREGRRPFGRDGSQARLELVEPVWDYPHTEGRAVTGGVVYRGKRLPELAGAYLFADYISGNIWALWYDGGKVTRHSRLVARELHGITAFGYDEGNEPHFTAFDGRVYRLRAASWAADLKRPFPARLSQTGLFTDVKSLTPHEGLIPYTINVPLWSDHAEKERFLALPAKGKVEYAATGKWQFPQGTVFVKTFSLDLTRGDPSTRKRLETRLLVRHAWGWEGYTYLWNEDETEAELHTKGLKRPYPVREKPGEYAQVQTWYFPSRTDCRACHTRAADYVLGLSTRQMNRPDERTGENQVSRLSRLGVFTNEAPDPATQERYPDWQAEPEWGDRAALAVRARAYLDANCAHCHTKGGPANQSKPELAYHVPLEEANVVGEAPERGRLGPPDSRLIRPGDPLRSELWLRVKTTTPNRMPMVGSSLPDHKAVEVLARWIEGMEQPEAQTQLTLSRWLWAGTGVAAGVVLALAGWLALRPRRGARG